MGMAAASCGRGWCEHFDSAILFVSFASGYSADAICFCRSKGRTSIFIAGRNDFLSADRRAAVGKIYDDFIRKDADGTRYLELENREYEVTGIIGNTGSDFKIIELWCRMIR